MEGSEKKFGLVEIVILLIIALIDDALTLASFLLLAIPVLGEISVLGIEIINFGLWALIMFWFIMKLGAFGGPAIAQLAGGLVQTVGFPARTLTVIIGVFLANHPRLAAVAQTATGKIGGVAQKEAAVAEEAGRAGPASIRPRGSAEQESPAEELAEQEPQGSSSSIPSIPEENFGASPTPFEELEKTFEEPPEIPYQEAA